MKVTKSTLSKWWRDNERLFRNLLKKIADDFNEDELLQELAVLTLIHKNEFSDEQHYKNWGIRRLRWLILNGIRSRRVNASALKKIVENQTLANNFQEEIGIKSMDLKNAIEKLETRDQKLIYFYLLGYSSKEISRHFSLSDSGIRTALARAKDNLMKNMEGD